MSAERPDAILLGDWVVVPAANRIFHGDSSRQLEPKVMGVLLYLIDSYGGVVSHEEFIDEVWQGQAVTGNVVTYSIAALRKALDDNWRAPTYIETIHKSGYRLVAKPEPSEWPTGAAAFTAMLGARRMQPTAAALDTQPRSRAHAAAESRPARPPRVASVAAIAAAVSIAAAIVAWSGLAASRPTPGSAAGEPRSETSMSGSELEPVPSEGSDPGPSAEWAPDGLHIVLRSADSGRTMLLRLPDPVVRWARHEGR